MCKFFSFCGDGHGNYLYADWAERVRLNHVEIDSHTAILTRGEVPPKKQEAWSFYEYNPLTKVFNIDRAVGGHDTEAARNWVEARDWKAIVEPLIVKPIVNPFDRRAPKVTREHIALLKQWTSVWASVADSVWASMRTSVWDSVWASVRAGVGDSVRDSVWASVWDSVWASVRAGVGDSVRDSVWASVADSVGDSMRTSVWTSVWASVWDSVADSVGAYISTFFAIKYKYDLSSAIQLWEAGLVPSFDGKIWRLHGGRKAKVLYEWTPKGKNDE